MFYFKLFLFSSLVGILGACAKSSSSNVSIAEFYVSYLVYVNDSGKVDCTANLQAGSGFGGTQIELSGNDTISCSVGTQSKQMSENSFIDTSYVAQNLDVLVGEVYTITLVKDGVNYAATATLPPPLTVSSPSAGATHALNTNMTIQWTPDSTDNYKISFSVIDKDGRGAGPTSAVKADSVGSDIITATEMQNAGLLAGAGTLEVSRYHTGTVPSEFKGGSFQAKQEKEIAITLQ